MEKVKFSTNVPVEVALKFTEGKLCDSAFGDPQYMFTTMDDRVFFVATKVAQKIHGLRLKPGELIDICKAEVPYSNGRKGIEWQVSRVNPPEGEAPNPPVGPQPNGTFVVGRVPANSQPGADVTAPAPAKAASQPLTRNIISPNGSRAADRFWAGKPESQEPPESDAPHPADVPPGNGGNSGNGNNHLPDARPKTRLEDALKTVVAAIQTTNEYAKSIGYAMPQFSGDEICRMVNTLMIGATRNGNGGGYV